MSRRMGYDAWLESPYQRECDDDDEDWTDCGCHRDEGDDACRDVAQCDECDRASNLGGLLINWQAEDAETGRAVMPPEVRAYFAERDARRASAGSRGDDCCEPDDDWDPGSVREP